MKKIIFILISLCVFARTYSQNKSDLYIFKNGTAFIVKKLDLKVENETAFIKEIPQATFGSLWLSAEGNQIKSVSNATEQFSEKFDVGTFQDVLKANQGKKVSIILQNDTKVSGSVKSMQNTGMISIKTTNSWFYTTLEQIKSIEFAEKPDNQFEVKQEKSVLKIDFAKSKSKQPLQMMYLQKGISWTPSYQINLLNDKEAQIKLIATLLNDVEDLNDASVNFVVGIPNFAYSYLTSPLATKEDVNSFITKLNQYSNQYYTSSGNRYNQSLNRADITYQTMSNAGGYADGYAELSVDYEEEGSYQPNLGGGQKAEDLFFYQSQSVSLKKGDRGMYEILDLKTTYTHLYEADLTSTPFGEGNDKIYLPKHYIVLDNISKVAWTTGTILLTKDINSNITPVSQDKLNYTPVGGKAKITLTQSSDVNVKYTEKEVTRSSGSKEKDGYVYEIATIEVNVEVRSYKTDDIHLKVTNRILGEAIKCSRDWKTTKQVNYYQSYNPNTSIEWEIPLKAGSLETFTYQYQQKIRRN
ncbi:MAG: hypothetical protein OHK0038_07870 [Flammeovirgaceae bacterium]